MYDRILVPTDGSGGVERAIRHAVDLAVAHEAQLYTVYVVNTASYGGLPMETSWEGIRDVLADEGQEAIDRVRELAGDVPVDGAIVDGSPARQILTYAEDNDCDLIVMGTHGRSGVDRLLLGSVAERVVRTSDIPVLTVRVGDVDEDTSTDDADHSMESEHGGDSTGGSETDGR